MFFSLDWTLCEYQKTQLNSKGHIRQFWGEQMWLYKVTARNYIVHFLDLCWELHFWDSLIGAVMQIQV